MVLPRTFALLLALIAASVHASPTADLREVGRASLKAMFWPIFDSTLFSPDGQFKQVEPGLALEIQYRRKLGSDALIASTRREWQKLSLYSEESEAWLAEAARLWPSLERGDRLLLKVDDDLGSEFYFNERLLGTLADPEFTRRFLAIFISERSSYPRLRDRLVGSVD